MHGCGRVGFNSRPFFDKLSQFLLLSQSKCTIHSIPSDSCHPKTTKATLTPLPSPPPWLAKAQWPKWKRRVQARRQFWKLLSILSKLQKTSSSACHRTTLTPEISTSELYELLNDKALSSSIIIFLGLALTTLLRSHHTVVDGIFSGNCSISRRWIKLLSYSNNLANENRP